jgi:excisionase family DNA binding protein
MFRQSRREVGGGDVTQLLTIEEVAQRLRVSVETVRWLRQQGRFAPAIKVGRRLMWDAGDVDAWLKAQRETTKVA